MTDTAGTDRAHPVAAALAVISGALTTTADTPMWSLDDATCRDLLVELTRVTTQLTELQARVAHQATVVEAGEEDGATSTAAWWAHQTRQVHTETHRAVRLGADLDRWTATRQAMARGEVLTDQARVIVTAVEALPDEVDLRRRCEQHLIDQAAHFDARHLRRLGRRVLEVVDPDAAEAHEAALLEKQERAAAKATSFSLHRDGSGTVRGRFAIPEVYAAMLEKALRAIAAPKHQRAEHGAGSYDHERPTAERMGQAFCEYVERYPADDVPKAGGTSATVVITMTLDALLGGIAAASMDNGEQITAATARRMACEAGLVPMVLGTGSVVLDQGRKTRLHTAAQRLAITVAQQHCQAGGCDVPASMCHVHHTDPWSTGGRTNTHDARLLCPRHHSLEHRRLDLVMRT